MHAQDDLNLYILRMFEGTSLLDGPLSHILLPVWLVAVPQMRINPTQ